MRKLFIILVGFMAIVTFIRAYDDYGNLNMEIPVEVSEEAVGEVSVPE